MILPNRDVALKIVDKYRYGKFDDPQRELRDELRAMDDVTLVGLIRYMDDLDGHSYNFVQTAFIVRDAAKDIFLRRKMVEVSDGQS